MFLCIFSSHSSTKSNQHHLRLCSLSPTTNPTSWLSPSGRFAFGFYPEGSGFAVGIWLTTNSNMTIVWMAHRNDPPVSIDARLVINNNGSLLLILPGGPVKLISNASEPASSASMLDSWQLRSLQHQFSYFMAEF
ncbi:G-type lectin S-receptor-like serine/threonine-protein kinase LECRK2 [Cinnamomum micranthum f. kanehirae]|uniref:G-type lectin S-receptor-like serine/threonine-protein kinase LECRK2 n=1 Tax=Cinnamomum micranthum f. kanehirae TaxID=337451 RepID=A0A443N992_9MAGN|nr:G-type lectin S-receptor-like serine/threonine-protein kinase LECRK2 [Cinnamomum micranthum f. kanehirae]